MGIAQSKYQFRSFTQKDGLSSNAVQKIIQDQKGFIWLATRNGLNRFDGQEFIKFRFDPRDSNSIQSNVINSLALDNRQNLWIGTSNGLSLINTISGHAERIKFTVNKKEWESLHIRGLFVDSQQKLWVGTQQNGVFQLSQNKAANSYDIERISNLSENSALNSVKEVTDFFEDNQGNIWIVHPFGLDRWDIQTKTIEHVRFPAFNPENINSGIFFATKEPNGNVLLTSIYSGIFYINPSSPEPQILPYFDSSFEFMTPGKMECYKVLIDYKNQYWVPTDYGIFIIDSTKTSYVIIKDNPEDLGALSSAKTRTVFQDVNSNIWIGTVDGGLNQQKVSADNYQFYKHNPNNPNSLAKGQVRTFAEDAEGYLWAGLLYSDVGVEKFSINEQQEFVKSASYGHNPNQKNSLSNNDIIQIFFDKKGDLWIGTNGHGLNQLNPETGSINVYSSDPGNSETLSGNRIWGICEDKNGFLWIGDFLSGLNRLDPESKIVKRFQHKPNQSNSLSNNRIKVMLTDSDGDIWIGTDFGLNKFNPETEQFTRYFHDPDVPNSLSSSFIFSLYEDVHKNLWIGTDQGLNKVTLFDKGQPLSKLDCVRFYEQDGLPSNTIFAVQGNPDGDILIGTDNGLAQLISTASKNSFRVINNDDGLENIFYPPKAHFYSEKRGQFFFGSRDGMLVFKPKEKQTEEEVPKILINNISRYEAGVEEGQIITDNFVSKENRLELTHRDEVVIFNLSELNWNKNKTYEYQLVGFSNQWRSLPDNMEISFSNLRSGNYTLLARSKNNNNIPGPESALLDIKVYPPWWRSTSAYIFYFLTAIGLSWVFYRFRLRRALEKQEAKYLKELDQAKSRFFTNISHEFRTPLTIISGMVDQVKTKPDLWLDRGTNIIKLNALNLLNLINQILDLRKLESKKLSLNMVQGDMVQYLKYITESYQSYAESQGLKLHFLDSTKSIIMDYDPDKILKVVSNLLSNATKYNKKGGHIYFYAEKIQKERDVLQIRVQDTGEGIPEDKLEGIFGRFVQANVPGEKKVMGSGIGLSLTHELVKLMGGEIEVKSKLGVGTTFIVELPIIKKSEVMDSFHTSSLSNLEKEATISMAMRPDQELVMPEKSDNEKKPTLLIVEDNAQIQQVLVATLEDVYSLRIAKDGEDGINKAIEETPDIIISDVMMPKKNGLELTQTLKNDERTDHIPIVLLTAKSDIESKIEGLQKGADAYIAKPFEERELRVRLEKLLELRKKLQARFAELSDFSTTKEAVITDPFLQKFYDLVEKEISNPDLNMNQMCRALGMSRSQVFRKTKALTGKSASNFIRSVRLQKGKELLTNTDLTVSEIAYDVGFTSLNYFSAAFFEEYGIRPSTFRN